MAAPRGCKSPRSTARTEGRLMPRRVTLVPDPPSVTVHVVLDDLGRSGRVWREIPEERADERDIVQAIVDGQFVRPVRIVAFDTTEGCSQDVTEDIARAVVELARKNGDALSRVATEFVERATGKDVTEVA
jgi:hypothetical protein